jgi:hypothetical protein
VSKRTDELQARFESIEKALAEVAGEKAAWAAASCAWLQVIELALKSNMEILASPVDQGPVHSQLEQFVEETRQMLQGFHQQLCKREGIDHRDALRMVSHFKEVLRDIVGVEIK